MDEYEVERVARDAAERAAEDVRREFGYKIDDLQRDVDRLRRELDEERSARREADTTLDAMLGAME